MSWTFKIAFIFGLIGGSLAPGAAAAEPEHCAQYDGWPEAGNEEFPPFQLLGLAITAVTGMRASCGLDTLVDRLYWQGYYRSKGCSDDSFAGDNISKLIAATIAKYEQEGPRIRETDPARYREMCDAANSCIVPDRYSSSGTPNSCFPPELVR